MADLEGMVGQFSSGLETFAGFRRSVFQTRDLLADADWAWGHQHGVYCFVHDGVVEYVGRALGKTPGERLWDHLRSLGDPEWEAVVRDPHRTVVIFALDDQHGYLAAALEVFLIDVLKPRFNLKRA